MQAFGSATCLHSIARVCRVAATAATAAALAGCAQTGEIRENTTSLRQEMAAPSPSPKRTRTATIKKRVDHRNAADAHSQASGEKFNTNELTAAHPTLPFGTALRVTDVTTGRSVRVRVNDRGPYVPGRIVDVSSAAAKELGIVDRGMTKVKLDVIE